MRSQLAKERRHPVVVERIERPAQRIVVEMLALDAFPDQTLGLAREEL